MGIPVWKEVLCLGVHFDPRTGERHEFKPAHVKRAHKNYQRMKERGVPVPACWEHQKHIEAGNAPPTDEAIAEWKRQYARYTFAHAIDSRINERGNLDMLLDVADQADAEQLPKVKFVSPKVYTAGYWDTKGGEYDGATVAHIAATPTPVQFWQKPFELSADDTFFLSFTPADAAAPDPVSLGLSEYKCPLCGGRAYNGDAKTGTRYRGGGKCADCDKTFSIVGMHLKPTRTPHADLSATLPADAAAQKSGSAPKWEPCPRQDWSIDDAYAALELSATDPPPDEEPPVADEYDDKGGDKSAPKKAGGKMTIADVIKALKDHGMSIPEEVEDEAGLVIAIKSQKGGMEPDGDEVPAEPAAGDTDPAQGGPPMLMSTTDANPKKRDRANKYAKDERDGATARISAALKGDGRTGRDPRTARVLLRRAAAVEMSFNRDYEAVGASWTKLLTDIAAYEKSVPTVRLRADGSPLDLSATAVVERPNPDGRVKDPTGQLGSDIILGSKTVAEAAAK